MMLKKIKPALFAILLTSVVTCTFADDAAPVYDADNYPPQFEGQSDSGAVATPQPSAVAGVPKQSLSLDQRLSRLEQQINNLQTKDPAAKVDELRTELQAMRGQIEQLTHQLQQVQTQQKTLYTDLDNRLNTRQAAAAKPSADIPNDTIPVDQKTTTIKTKSKKQSSDADIKKNTEQPNVAEEQQIYQTAYDLIKAKKYNEAIAALQKMLQKYPSGQFAANAHYWLGELYGLLGKNDQSAVEFSNVVENYPDSPKVSDAQLKLGLIYAAQFKWSDAKSAFKKVINHYPGSASARLAAEQLKQIKQAGH